MNQQINRRHFLAGTGALTVSVMMPGVAARAATNGLEKRPPLDPKKLASYISINADGTATAYFGKMDMGQGTDIGVAQMVAEELDLAVERVLIDMGDSGTSLNQGGASGSTGVSHGGATLRNAAAEARRQLVEMAAKHLSVAADDLVVANGVISAKADAAKKVTYGELIGGRWFDTEVEWNGKIGNDLSMKSPAKLKDPKDYKVYGTSPPRRDVAPKILGTGDFVTDIRVEGMVHARMVMPPVAGAEPVSVDEASIKRIPGAQIVWQKAFLGVVAPKEWDAVKAARALKVTWSDAKPPFVDQKQLYKHIRDTKSVKDGSAGPLAKEPEKVEAAFKNAARVIEASYEWPFQSHASMGPACAVVDYKPMASRHCGPARKSHISQVMALQRSWVLNLNRCVASGCRDRAAMAAMMRVTQPLQRPSSRKQSASQYASNPCVMRARLGAPSHLHQCIRCGRPLIKMGA